MAGSCPELGIVAKNEPESGSVGDTWTGVRVAQKVLQNSELSATGGGRKSSQSSVSDIAVRVG